MKKNVLLRLYPWVLAGAILAVLFLRIPLRDLKTGISKGPLLSLSIYVFFQVLIVLLLDAYATNVSLSVTGFKQQYKTIFLARGATYLIGVLNYILGQGALGAFLHRCGIKGTHATGAILLIITINVGVLMLIAFLGSLGGGLPSFASRMISLPGFLLLAGIVVYLITVAIRPRLLQRYPLFTSLWEAGLRGHLLAAAGRFPHVFILVLTHWGAMRLWGIAVPLSIGMTMIPVVLFIAALPVTPAGLGSSQGVQVVLFSPYVHALTPEARAAEVLAYSLVYYFLGIAIQVLLGFFCWQRLRHVVNK